MSKQEYKKGDVLAVEVDSVEVEFIVKGYYRGWYEAVGGKKFRAKQIVRQIDEISIEEESDPEDYVHGGDEEVLENAPKASMAESLQKRRSAYVSSTTASGKPSLRTDDELAKLMVGMGTDEAIDFAERVCELEEGELVARYDHLNAGAIRMNCGNLVRGALKRGDTNITTVRKAAKG